MAKRKRLTPPRPGFLSPPPVATGLSPATGLRAPIAQVAGEASATSALKELVSEMQAARDEGRLIQAIACEQIDEHYLIRDRVCADEDELQVLTASLRLRGQQTPIEVVDTGNGGYGLISGWRRLIALRQLFAETEDHKFKTVQAILRRPETAADAYISMVEENEVRVGLSYYERARVAAKAVEQGAYDSEKKALLSLFATASRAKRSKIRSFLTIYHALDAALHYPAMISERLGLALAKALDADPNLAARLAARLSKDNGHMTPDAEMAVLAEVEQGMGTKPTESGPPSVQSGETGQALPHKKASALGESAPAPAPGIRINYETRRGQQAVVLIGDGITDAFCEQLRMWLQEQAQP